MSAEGAMQSECRSFEIGDRHKIARQKHSSLAFLIAQFGACHRFRGTHFTLYLHAGFGQNVSTFFLEELPWQTDFHDATSWDKRRWLEPQLLSPVITKTNRFRPVFSARPEQRFRFWRWAAGAGCSRTKKKMMPW